MKRSKLKPLGIKTETEMATIWSDALATANLEIARMIDDACQIK